jgi:hypothetical protein
MLKRRPRRSSMLVWSVSEGVVISVKVVAINGDGESA